MAMFRNRAEECMNFIPLKPIDTRTSGCEGLYRACELPIGVTALLRKPEEGPSPLGDSVLRRLRSFSNTLGEPKRHLFLRERVKAAVVEVTGERYSE